MKIAVCYATQTGQTEKIANFISDILKRAGHDAQAIAVSNKAASGLISGFDAFILGASVRMGKAHGKAISFVKKYLAQLNAKKPGLFLTCLAAKSAPDGPQNEAAKYLQEFAQSSGLNPALSAAFAGSLPYTKYNPLVRMLMKKISETQGGDSDTSRDYEYTNWDSVKEFAVAYMKLISNP